MTLLTRPKEKGVTISEKRIEKPKVVEVGYEGKGKGILLEEPKKKRKLIQSPMVQTQEEMDRELALQFQEEERVAFEKAQEAAKESARLHKEKRVNSKATAVAARKQYSEFLKSVGYSGRQLGPMKLVNLADLYKVEKKKKEDEEERKRYLRERER